MAQQYNSRKEIGKKINGGRCHSERWHVLCSSFKGNIISSSVMPSSQEDGIGLGIEAMPEGKKQQQSSGKERKEGK